MAVRNALDCLRRAAAVALASAALQATAADRIVVTGAVKTPLSLTLDDLKAFPAEQIQSLAITRRSGDKDTPTTVRGVRLTAVLERAGLASSGRHEWKHTIVLATASDGYQVVFSWPELVNTDVGAAVLVVFERDGKPPADAEGSIALVSGRDLRAGPRSVRGLTRLDVRVVKE